MTILSVNRYNLDSLIKILVCGTKEVYFYTLNIFRNIIFQFYNENVVCFLHHKNKEI